MSKKNYKKQEAQYIPPEMMNYALCSACLNVVLEQNEEAKELFEGLVECFRLPGYQMMLEEAEDFIPDTGTIFQELIEKSVRLERIKVIELPAGRIHTEFWLR